MRSSLVRSTSLKQQGADPHAKSLASFLPSRDVVQPTVIAWFHPSRLYGDVSSAIVQWPDRSTNRRHAVQGTAAARPTVASDSYGKYAAMGATGYLSCTGFSGSSNWGQPSNYAQPITCIYVGRFAAVTSGSNRYAVAGAVSSHCDFGLDTNGIPKVDSGATGQTGGHAFNDGAWHVFVTIADVTGVSVYVDGWLMQARSTAGGTNPLGPMGLGGQYTGTNPMNGDLREVIVMQGRLSDEQITFASQQLGAQYGITIEDQSAGAFAHIDSTSSNGNAIRYWLPPAYQTKGSLPLLIWCHPHAQDEKIFPGYFAYPLAQAAVNRGWMMAASNMDGNAWGSNTGLADIADLYTTMNAIHSVSSIIMVGASMGGASALLTIPNATVPNIKGVLLIDGVTDLNQMHSNVTYTTSIETAYGCVAGTLSSSSLASAVTISSSVSFPVGTVIMIDPNGTHPEQVTTTSVSGAGPYTIGVPALGFAHSSGVSVSDFPTKSSGHDPNLRAATDFGTVPMRFYASTSDTAVPKALHADVFGPKVAGTRSEAVVVTHVGGHINHTSMWPDECAAFIARCLAA